MKVVRLKKIHPKAEIPTRATEGSAGWDLYAASVTYRGSQVIYDTGIALQLPEGYVGLLFQRSSVYKKPQRLCNAVGVLDQDFLGTVKFIFDHDSVDLGDLYQIGDRIGQLVLIKYDEIMFEEVDELNETSRGVGGFGSSGN